jgi:chromosome segregation ATPase
MAMAMLIVGLLIGVALTVTVAAFGVLSMDGRFRDNVRAAMNECRNRLTGRHPRAQNVGPARSVEGDARIRALQEEVRVMQRLMDQARVERETQAEESRRAGAEILTLRGLLAEREEQLGSRNAALAEATAAAARAREELAERSAELARSRRDAKGLETELGILQSGDGLGAISDEIAHLTRERDELKAQLDRLAQQVTPGVPMAANR